MPAGLGDRGKPQTNSRCICGFQGVGGGYPPWSSDPSPRPRSIPVTRLLCWGSRGVSGGSSSRPGPGQRHAGSPSLGGRLRPRGLEATSGSRSPGACVAVGAAMCLKRSQLPGTEKRSSLNRENRRHVKRHLGPETGYGSHVPARGHHRPEHVPAWKRSRLIENAGSFSHGTSLKTPK